MQGREARFRAPGAATEAQVQNLDPLAGGVPSYIPNPPLDCNTELFNHALETIWGEISRERETEEWEDSCGWRGGRESVPESEAVAKMLPFMKQDRPTRRAQGSDAASPSSSRRDAGHDRFLGQILGESPRTTPTLTRGPLLSSPPPGPQTDPLT